MIKYLSKVFYVLTGSKKKLLLLLLVFIFSSIIEALGIGLIGPFLNFASNPESIHNFVILDWIYQQLNLQDSSQFIPILALGIAILFCLKSCFSLLAQLYIYKFAFNQKSLLRSRLINAYLNLPYTFHLKKNTASIIKNAVIETFKFSHQTLLPLLQITANLLLTLVLLIVLAKTKLLLLVLILLVLTPAFLLYYSLRKKISRWGKKLSLAEQGMIRVINHGLGGIKETRIIGCETYFERQMQLESYKYERSAVMFNITQKSTRIIVETILIVFILFFVAVSQVFFGQDTQEITSVLAVFSVVSFRLIPTMSNIISDIGRMQNSSYVLDILCLDLKEIEEEKINISTVSNKHSSIHPYSRDDRHLNFTNEVELRKLTYSYPDISEPAIEDISINLKKGQSIAFIGKSGAGKTTLVDVILGLLKPQSGNILVDGKSIYKDLRSWQNLIGYIPQSIFLTDDTIKNNIAFGVEEHLIDPEKLHQAIQASQLSELIEQLPNGINTPVGERGVRLSGGQRQRIGIARALYHEREILVLDEATSALDNETERLVNEEIKSLAGTKTLIIIAHRLSTVEHCDCVYLLEKGRLIRSGSYQEIIV